MKLDAQINLCQRVKSTLAAMFQRARREQWPQSMILDHREQVFANLHPKLPQVRRAELRAFAEGYFAALVDSFTVHLYTVDGTLYRLTHDKRPETAHLPAWDSLPEREYSALADKGAIHWVGPGLGVFFKSGT